MEAVYVFSSGEKKSIFIEFKNQTCAIFEPDTKKLISETHYTQLEFELGGNNRSLIFIKLNSTQQDLIYLEASPQNLKLLKANENLKFKLEPLFKSRRNFLNLSILGIFLILFGMFLLYQFRGPITSTAAVIIPFSAEKKIADQFLNSKLKPEQVALQIELAEMAKRLSFEGSLVSSKWNPEYTFHISSNTEPNAYATIGGHVFVNKGFISLTDSVEDLLGVLAHEMVHVQKRHVARSMIQALGVFTILSVFLGDITGVIGVVLDQGGPLLNLSYSRELEEEADEQALYLLTQNKINPIGLSNSLEKINNETQKLISQQPAAEIIEKLQKIEILNSHPEIEKRILQLGEKASDLTKTHYTEKIVYDYQKFKNEVQKHF